MAKDRPLMHKAQLMALQEWVKCEIEFAFSVENGGRYNRENLRARCREARKDVRELLTEIPLGQFGLGSSEEEDDAHLEAAVSSGGGLSELLPERQEEEEDDDERLADLREEDDDHAPHVSRL